MARKKRVTGPLERVHPRNGDAVLVKNFGDRGSDYYHGRIDEHARVEINEDTGRPLWEVGQTTRFHRVVFLCRTALIRLEPAWDQHWDRGKVLYREQVPQPGDGDLVVRRNREAHDWRIVMVLLGIDAQPLGARTFDKYWYVVACGGNSRGVVKTARMWCRWCYSGHAFVPVQDRWLSRKLNRLIPR